MPWPADDRRDDDDDALPPRQRKMRQERLAREAEQRARLLALPQTADHAIDLSPCRRAHLRWGNRYFVVSALMQTPPASWTLAYALLPGDGVQDLREDVRSIRNFLREKAKGKLRTAGVPADRAIWLPVHPGNWSNPYALPDTVSVEVSTIIEPETELAPAEQIGT